MPKRSIAVLLVALLADAAGACATFPARMAATHPIRTARSADVVFHGRLLSWEPVDTYTFEATFAVERVWKGDVEGDLVLIVPLQTECDVALLEDLDYVIFADQTDGELRIRAPVTGSDAQVVADRLSRWRRSRFPYDR